MKIFSVFSRHSTFFATLWILSSLIGVAHSIEPVSTVFGVSALTVAGIGMLYKPIFCRLQECCEERWIRPTVPNLKASLEASVYGQHLVVSSVVNSLKGHLRHSSPKALVFSFQGWTGTGKNLVARIIADNMYINGLQSKYVHILSATKHFSRHERVADYKDKLKDWLIGNISVCPNQLFIFDEVEKMPSGLLDVLKPFVDYAEITSEGVDYRKAVYILLGNAGGKVLFDKTYEHYKDGKKREKLELRDLETKLWTKAYHEKGGLERSSLITSELINAYVPFLPLEKRHVKLCIQNDIESKNFTLFTQGREQYDAIVSKVMAQLTFTPAKAEVYSSSGCKRVFQKVNYILQDLDI